MGLFGSLIGGVVGAIFGDKIGIAGFGGAMNGSIPCAIVGAVIGGLLGGQTSNSSPKPVFPIEGTSCPKVNEKVTTAENDIATQVIEIRRVTGLSDLIYDDQLSTVARYKSQDMDKNKRLDLVSDTYGNVQNMVTGFGVPFETVGIALGEGYKKKGFSVYEWASRNGIEEIIKENSFTRIGVGYVKNGIFAKGYFTVLLAK